MSGGFSSIPTEQLRQMAVAAAAQSNLAGAEQALREVVRRAPRDAGALIDLASVLKSRAERREALQLERRAVAAAPRDARAHQALADSLHATGQFEAAARAYSVVQKLRPDDPHVLTGLAASLERLRRVDEAKVALRRALELDPTNSPALAALGQLHAESGEIAEAEACIDLAIARAKDPGCRSTAWHRLGALRESQRLWDDAFAAHDRGNRTTSAMVMARAAAPLTLTTELRSVLIDEEESIVARWSRAPVQDGLRDPVFLVGFPRSGTTLTEQVLGSLPGSLTTDEEPVLDEARMQVVRWCSASAAPTLVQALDTLSAEQIHAARSLYWRSVERMVDPRAHAADLFVDKQPLRFIHAALLNRIFPRSKIIFVIRDPRDCCLSCFFQDFAPYGPMARSTTLEGIGDLYAEVMTFWMRARTKISLPYLEVRYEDMVADFEPHARRLVEFVGREWTDDVLRFHEKAAGRAIRTPSFRSVTQKINTRAVGKWAHYEKHLGPLIERVRPFLEPLGYEE